MHSFLSLYPRQPLADLLANKAPVSLEESALSWLEVPPQDFIAYLENRPATVNAGALSLDGVQCHPERHRRPPTYSIVQMHRLWVTTVIVEKYCRSDAFVVDLGAFPFALEMVLREHRGFTGRMLGTVNLPMNPEWLDALKQGSIETAPLNLDPYVRDSETGVDLPTRLDLPDATADFVVLAHVIEHLYHPLIILGEAWRVLKPGGRILVSTDNAMGLEPLLRMLWMNDFIYDPVEQTAAMSFHFWRGHNRFYTAPDLEALLKSLGFTHLETAFREVFYDRFSSEFFHNPLPIIPRWRADVLTEIPGYRNEVLVVAEKPI